ncbi:cation transporter [Aquimarina sp. ERC-38]|uniref:heavy-metal-associated domain-containing protein n=1 Tax=Aquimarina sp. ERC-38 TaxID=2949996 RepID=UPI0022476B4A|nr:heavy-metal-associated domain-containing protein [Aquimarina sp. ERC-38]UZO80858.1 cation transporter [Aquimarina sp. ERC-38]
MKNIIIILWLSAIGTITLQAQKNKEMDTFEVQVDGLGCPFCAYGLEKKFKEFKGIKDVKIDIETGDFSFSYPSDKELTLEALTSQVVKAGYTPNLATIQRADGSIETNRKTVETPSNTENLLTDQLTVFGNCEMCKARIEKAVLDISGVAEASWNAKNQLLKVSYDSLQTTKDKIEETIVATGHETKDKKTPDATFKSLPGCCQYKRELK